MNRNAMPARSASPATTRFAEAPISVPFPPRQAPSDSDHHSGSSAASPPRLGSHRLDQRNHRRDERDVVDERRQDRRRPEDRERGHVEIAAGGLEQRLRHHVDEAGLLDAVNEDEQSQEEHQRDPFGLRERRVHVLRLRFRILAQVVEQHQHRCAEDGDRRGLDLDLPLQHEPDDDERDHEQRLLEEPAVGDRLALVEAHHVPPVLLGRDEVAPPDVVERHHRRRHDRRR